MAYKVKGVPPNAFFGGYTFNPEKTSPEQIQAQTSTAQADSLARQLGLINTAPPSTEAMSTMNPAEMTAVMQGQEKGGNQRLISLLLLLGSLVAPPLMVPAAAMAGQRKATEGNVRDITAGAEKRYAANQAQKNFLLDQSRQSEEFAQKNTFQQMMEGLTASPGAVPGYTSVGEARGRMASAAEDKATAAHQKMLGKLEASTTVLFDKAMAGTITEEEAKRLKFGLDTLQSLKAAGAVGFMGGAPQVPPIPEFPFSKKGKAKGAKKPSATAVLTPAAAPIPAAGGMLSEEEARAQLEASGIIGKEADAWILLYRKAGKVK
jgi:hypothetical protein